ncbi:exopolysaccharide biosynthesis protein [Sphingomonas sp. MMS24-J45]|uniref:exopolysaccharide biosynthesis protein n=1 Tax=Sphingomonas sp. MMS24-J45 TaxID=3238806 RepID=UPI00384A960F
MSDMTPRKVKASLLERAAEVYDFAEHARARNAPVAEQPVVQAPVAQPKVAAPAPVKIAPRGGVTAIDRGLLSARGIIVPGAPIDALTEEFRLVKRQLLTTARTIRRSDADLSRTILVCSAQPNDGKTYCAVNLAISMAAERDVEVLLIDADFAKPDVMARLGLPEGPGLLDALADPKIDIERCVVRTDVPQLSLLPCGTKTTSDTELVASARTGALIAQLLAADPTRILIFDSPPVLAASPASVLANYAGQAMLVVRADRTGESDLREAVALLDGCEHVQLVLNAVAHAPGGRRFGSYYTQGEDAV